MVTKMTSDVRENVPSDVVITKNQNDKPVVTASALNLGEDNSMLNRIDKCHKTALSKRRNSNHHN